MTPFSILGLDESIDDDEQIKLAYLTKTRQFPPITRRRRFSAFVKRMRPSPPPNSGATISSSTAPLVNLRR